MKLFAAITKVDEEQRMVFGYASTEALDSQGEIIQRAAIEAALPDYMKFANIREMHSNSAVGVAKEAEMDEKGLYIAVKVVDDAAWEKVKEGVYKGFSIGGRATARDEVEKHVITGVTLSEISLVDRPANPDAVFDVFKAETPKRELKQVWNCGVPGHEHIHKADAGKCLAAIDALVSTGMSEADAITKMQTVVIVSAGPTAEGVAQFLKDKADDITKALDAEPEQPPAAEQQPEVKKGMWQVSFLAQILSDLDSLRCSAEWEAADEGDNSPVPAQLKEQVNALADTLVAMAAEESAELTQDKAASEQSGDLNKVEQSSDDAIAKAVDAAAEVMLTKMQEITDDLTAKIEKKFVAHFETLETRIKAIEAQPVPAKGALRAIGKGEDAVTQDHQQATTIEKAPTATELIKAAHAQPRAFP